MTWSEARAEAAMMVLRYIKDIEDSPRLNHNDDPNANSRINDEIQKIRTWLHQRAYHSTKASCSLTKKAV